MLTFSGSYEENKCLVLVSIKCEQSLANLANPCNNPTELFMIFIPIFNCLSYIHECGICHTNIIKENIVLINNLYRLRNVGENYLYNFKQLNGNEKDVRDYNTFFTIKKDYVKLEEIMMDYIPKDDKKLKKYIKNIFTEIKNSKNNDEINGLEIFKKYIVCKYSININTIIKKEERYKLAYFRDPIIKMDVETFINEMKRMKEEEEKYFLSECFLNYVVYEKNDKDDSEFDKLKTFFLELIKSQNKEIKPQSLILNCKRKIMKEMEKDMTIEEVLMDRNTRIILLNNRLTHLNDYETVIFSILLTYFHNVEILRIGKNYFDDLATRNILKGIKNYTNLVELNMKSMFFIYLNNSVTFFFCFIENIIRNSQKM